MKYFPIQESMCSTIANPNPRSFAEHCGTDSKVVHRFIEASRCGDGWKVGRPEGGIIRAQQTPGGCFTCTQRVHFGPCRPWKNNVSPKHLNCLLLLLHYYWTVRTRKIQCVGEVWHWLVTLNMRYSIAVFHRTSFLGVFRCLSWPVHGGDARIWEFIFGKVRCYN